VTEITLGTAVAGYRVEAVLGAGSMGTVYSALDVALERRVALKVLTPELSRDERFRERFLRESKLAASLEHPHIVPIHSAGEADGVLYLAMRYVEGRDLGALLASLGRIEAERVLAILDQVAEALDAAHARGLVHRDVKPANILLAYGDYAYLCDFGLAKHASTVSSLTGSRAILGTVDYLAPEQIEAKPVDGRVDVYALGCVLYECLTGEPPHRRGNEIAALLAHVNDPPPKVSERRAEFPATLDDVIATALAKDRELRFATCAELVGAARVALSGEAPALPVLPAVAAPAVRSFVFADVRGYTAYTGEQGDEAGAALARRFAEIVETLAPNYAGVLQELRGDEALVVFDSPRQALRFALALQAKVTEEDLARPIGVGLDTGEAVPVEGGYRGGALNRAARLCALARPGEVLASDAVRELAGAAEGVAYGFRRVERLKGFEKPVGVVEIHPAEMAPRRQGLRRMKRTMGGARPRRRLLAVLAVAAVAVAVPLVLLGGSGSAYAANSVGLIDTSTLKPAGAISGLAGVGAIWNKSGQVWAIDSNDDLVRLDPKSGKQIAHLSVPFDVGAIAVAPGSLWVTNGDSDVVYRYDPTYGTRKSISLPAGGLDYTGAEGITYADGSIWVGYSKFPFRVVRINPATDQIIKTFNFPSSDGSALLASGGGSVWVATQNKAHIWRIDPKVNEIAMHTQLHAGPALDLTVADGYAWLPVQGDAAVWQVDPNGTVLRSYPTGQNPVSVGAGGGYVFVANEASNSVSRIDPATQTVKTVEVSHAPETAAVIGNRVWVWLNPTAADVTAGLDPSSVLRIATIDNPYWTPDPALYASGNVQSQEAIGARLLRYPDAAPPQGATLVPEISDLPTVSNGGKTYTFHIRSGYRFSPPSGAPVTAAVMRYSIERALSPGFTAAPAFGAPIVNDLVGLQDYRDGKVAHISGIHVHGEDLVFTLVAADPDFPARISESYFSAVPLGTPVRPGGLGQPIPSAGPYYIAGEDFPSGGNTLVLKPNPNYHGPRSHHLEAIVVNANVGTPAVQEAAANTIDYAWTDTAPASDLEPGNGLDRRFGKGASERYFAPAVAGNRYFVFNTESGIFRSAKLRRAVNYALDRPALAAATSDLPSADLLPPGIPGAGGGKPLYPLTKPDLAKAQALARGTHGRAVLLIGNSDNCPYCSSVTATVEGDLAALGITVVPKFVSAVGDFVTEHPHANWDFASWDWLADFPDPSDFVNSIYDTEQPPQGLAWSQPWTRYSDPRFLREMRAAYHVTGGGRAAAYHRLVTQMMLESPPAAVYATIRGTPQLFSSRIGCQVFRPMNNGLVDLAALCIR
jgi:serine/threonine-protein kinase